MAYKKENKIVQMAIPTDLYNLIKKQADKNFCSIQSVITKTLSDSFINKNIYYVVVDSDGAPIDNKSFKDKKEAVKERKKVEKELNIECFISEVIPVKED